MSESREIPNGWASITLGDIGEIVSGGTPSTSIPEYWNGEINWIAPSDLSGYFNKYISYGAKSISEAGLNKSSARLMPKGSVLFSSRAPIGYVVIANSELCTNQGFKSIIPNKAIFNEYLFYFLKSAKRKAEDVASGTTFKEISLSTFSKLQIPFPPLPEQHRIVAKIEELFSSLDKGIESLKTAQQQLKVYRQAVLKWAFEGKLTEAFRNANNQLKDASSILSDIRKNRENWFKKSGKKLKQIAEINNHDLPELPKKWCWVKIVETVLNTADDIVDGPFGSNLKNSDYVDGAPVPVISISNIEEGFDKKIRYITDEKFETIKRSAVYPGDIIVAKIGSTYGKTGIYPELMPIGVIPANLLRIRPSKHYSKRLLFHYLQSIVFKKRLDKIMKSTAQPAFNVSMFKDLPIPFMSLEEQNKLLDEIESRLSVCDKIEESIEHSLKQSEALRQSILKKAFEGKLVPQDPNDEPASVLLDRIKGEREKDKPANPPRR